jgi:thiol-disulfide isomerase/thioredoxin
VKNSSIVAAVLVLLFTGLSFAGKSPTSHSVNTAVPGARADPFVGKAAPDFELKVLNTKSKTLKLSDLKGMAILVNFWATFCGPCKVEMPWLVDLQKKYGPEGLQIVGIAMDHTAEKTIVRFAHKMGVNYPIVMGTQDVADSYGGAVGMPQSFFVDRSGKIVAHEVGLRTLETIESNVRKSLGNSNAAKTASAP